MIRRNQLIELMQPSLAELKAHIHYTSDALDGELMSVLLASVASCEHEIGQIISLSDFVLTCPFDKTIFLHEIPFVKVDYVKVDDEECNDYTVTDDGIITFGEEVSGESLEIGYQCGMAEVPYDIRAAILLKAASLFANPENSIEEHTQTAAANLLRSHRKYGKRKN